MHDSNLLCEAGDRIDNATFAAMSALTHNADNLAWNMGIIGEVNDFIENALLKHGIDTCHPWQDDKENICYSTKERCAYCTRQVKRRQ